MITVAAYFCKSMNYTYFEFIKEHATHGATSHSSMNKNRLSSDNCGSLLLQKHEQRNIYQTGPSNKKMRRHLSSFQSPCRLIKEETNLVFFFFEIWQPQQGKTHSNTFLSFKLVLINNSAALCHFAFLYC